MFEIILNMAKVIPADKIAHFSVGFCMFAAISWASTIAACIFVVVAAIGKEIYDSKHSDKHTSDILDAIATVVGGAIGLFIKMV